MSESAQGQISAEKLTWSRRVRYISQLIDIFQLNASSVEYSTDPVEYTTEVPQLI